MGSTWLTAFNAFIEDTCVIVTLAWLLTRTRAVSDLYAGTGSPSISWLGVLFGLLASSEVVFQGARSPYVLHSMIVCLAQFVGGGIVSIPAALMVVITDAGLYGTSSAGQLGLLLSISVFLPAAIRWVWHRPTHTWVVVATGGMAQAVTVLVRGSGLVHWDPVGAPGYPVESIPANMFGLLLIMQVWSDARTRLQSEAHRLQAEHMRTLVVTSELAALRARIRPHFLFNALSVIAALCDIDPKKAQSSTMKMGQLMRRHIEVDGGNLITISTELEYVRTYVELQSLRFGKRVTINFEVDPDAVHCEIPSFCLQTLVENAFVHGIEPKSSPGAIQIFARRTRGLVLVGVKDDGQGMDEARRMTCVDRPTQTTHGLGLVNQQLTLTFGRQSRIRVFSAPGKGALFVFRAPAGYAQREWEGQI